MKWYTFLIAIALLFVQCGGGDDDGDGPNNIVPETFGTVSMKIDGISYSLKVFKAVIRHNANDPEEGVFVIMGANCDEPLKFHFEMKPQLGEQDVSQSCTIGFNWYDQTWCGFDRSQLDNVVNIELFSEGTSELTEMGARYKGTFSGRTEPQSGGRGHEITDGIFDVRLSD